MNPGPPSSGGTTVVPPGSGLAQSPPSFVYDPDPRDPDAIASLVKELGIRPITARVLLRRGVRTPEAGDRFLHPRIEHLDEYDPYVLLDFRKAVGRLARAAVDAELVGVFGDYDVDGITSTAVIADTLRTLGCPLVLRLANREVSYGLTQGDVEAFHVAGCRVVVVCDVGLAADGGAAARRIAEHGLHVIRLDHHRHQPPEDHPWHAQVVPGWREPLPEQPFHHLSTVGVAFITVWALVNRELQSSGFFRSRPKPDVTELLDLVAIGTIADVVPLSALNRLLVSEGLARVNALRRPGLRHLARQVRLPGGATITVKDIAFRLTPRLAAAGRMRRAMPALDLLLALDAKTAQLTAAGLDGFNRQRQRHQEKAFLEALAQVEVAGPGRPIYVVASDAWHQGVVGIIASKLADRFCRPAAVIAVDARGIGRGSVRSFAGVDVCECLEIADGLLLSHGGHPSAAGLTVAQENIPALAAQLEQAVEAQYGGRGRPRNLVAVDAAVRLDEVDARLVAELEHLQPCGEGNPEPVLLATGVLVEESRIVGNGHLRLRVRDERGGCTLEAIGFGLGHQAPPLRSRVRLVFVPENNTYRGKTSLQLRLLSIQPDEGGGLP